MQQDMQQDAAAGDRRHYPLLYNIYFPVWFLIPFVLWTPSQNTVWSHLNKTMAHLKYG
jgi:hypothetical protein